MNILIIFRKPLLFSSQYFLSLLYWLSHLQALFQQTSVMQHYLKIYLIHIQNPAWKNELFKLSTRILYGRRFITYHFSLFVLLKTLLPMKLMSLQVFEVLLGSLIFDSLHLFLQVFQSWDLVQPEYRNYDRFISVTNSI